MTADNDCIAGFQKFEQARNIIAQYAADGAFAGRQQRHMRNKKSITAVGICLYGFFKKLNIDIHYIIKEVKVFADSQRVIGIFAVEIFDRFIQIRIDYFVPGASAVGTAGIVIAADDQSFTETAGQLLNCAKVLRLQSMIETRKYVVQKLTRMDSSYEKTESGLVEDD